MTKAKMLLPSCLLMTLVSMLTACEQGVLDPKEPGNLVPKTVTEDSSLPAFEMNGSRFHLQSFGDADKPLLIVLHGGPGGDHRGLLRLIDRYDGYALTDSFHVIMWDQRSAGLSQRHAESEISLELYLADILALADHFSPNKPVYLIGHSWGGQYATQFINAYPQRVAGAVLYEPGPLNAVLFDEVIEDIIKLDYFSEWLNDFAWAQQFFSPNDHIRMDYERGLGYRGAQPHFHQEVDRDPMKFWRWGAAANRYVQADGMRDGEAVYSFTDNLSAYETPVWFVAGSLTEVIGQEFQERQRQYFPKSELHIIEGMGHDHVWRAAQASVAIFREYIRQLKDN